MPETEDPASGDFAEIMQLVDELQARVALYTANSRGETGASASTDKPAEATAYPHPPKHRLRCSFCGKLATQVKSMIAGPGVYICNECVDLCAEIIEEQDADRAAAAQEAKDESKD